MKEQDPSLHYTRFTPEEDAYIRAHYPLGKVGDIAKHVQRSERSVICRAHALQVRKLNKGKRVSALWTPELREVMGLLYEDLENLDLAKFLGVSVHMVRSEAKRQGLRKTDLFMYQQRCTVLKNAGVQFGPGNRPWNVGIAEPEHPMHQRGHYRNGPHPRALPIGTIKERPQQLGQKKLMYRFIKVSEGLWRPVHQLTWEQHHGKPVPKGHSIVFRDGDHDNYDPENLLCLTFEELSMCSTQSLPYDVLPLVKRKRALSKAIKAREKTAQQHQ